ncbi:hypothetical protein CDL12_21226 [Handroanthus impetiginosus]|uniref:PRA1 family protein n=1 Tax=Handroanthus impetiginosus TaxID=429701 RepID=A0A2G9GLX9_9LAMI|nr:hypothetical protein CDL12_21226 [Handroanthus impetiginosus]
MASDHNTTSSPPNKSISLPTGKNLQSFNFSSSIPESAIVRIIRNLGKFSLSYSVFIWTALFFTLVLNWKISFLYLIAMTQITLLYSVLMHILPDLFMLHKAIDKRFFWFLVFVMMLLLVVITAFVLIQTSGETFLFTSYVVTMGVVVLHAALSNVEDDFVDEFGEKSEDLV